MAKPNAHTGTGQSCCYSKTNEENMDLIFTLAENVRCMQRNEGEEKLWSRRNGPNFCQKSTEMWKSGRLRDTNLKSEKDMKNHDVSLYMSRAISQIFCMSILTVTYWKTFLCAVLLCVLLKETRLCSAASTCYGLGTTGRIILNDLEGSISDHPNESYPMHTECEWLIEAPSSDMKIMLTFSSFATECSYDFVSVYDGNSHQSHMIAALSGDSIPSTLIAESGQMLIYLYSDRNYNLRGFDATYTIEDCPFGCSGHGTCADHSCVCHTGYEGSSCERLKCPYECGNQLSPSQGTCNNVECECSNGFVGESCSLSTTSNSGWGQTFLVSSGDGDGFSKRVGHAAVYHEDTDSLWVYGGYDLNTPLDDLIQYSFETDEWTHINPNGSVKPSGRYRHIMELYENHLLVFGGVLANGSYSNELWSFDLTTLAWELLPPGTDSVPPGLAHHSSCIVEYSYLVVIGGESEENSFLGTVYKYDLQLQQGWEEITPRGGIGNQVKLRDHSSVYHYDTKSIIVFGGLQPSQNRNSLISRRIGTVYAFQFEDRYWTKMASTGSVRERSFHSANIIGNYMVVYGGSVHTHLSNTQGLVHVDDYGDNEKCFEDGIELYHLGCHKWIAFDDLAQDFKDNVDRNSYNVTKGRFAHASAVRDDTTLLVIGGFNGVTQGDIIAIKMPGAVAVNPSTANQSLDICGMHTSESSCLVDPECGWCSGSSRCLSFSASSSCSGTFTQSECPGICNALTTCQACMLWGQGPQTVTFDPAIVRVNEKCGWCVQDRKCYPISAPTGYCNSLISLSNSVAWWGSNGTFISDFDHCKTRDFPPGMLWVKYRQPQNLSHPDEVSLVSNTQQSLAFYPNLQSEGELGGYYTAVFKGFLYPQQASPAGTQSLQVYLKATKAAATLYMSSNDDPADEESVAERALSSTQEDPILAERAGPSPDPIFPDTSKGNRYYVRLEENKTVTATAHYSSSAMELLWNGNLASDTAVSQSFTSEYIQPYASSSCTEYSTCRGCLTDASCGWCPLSDTCELRNGATLSVDRCGVASGPRHYLLLDVENCGNCSQHWNCELCVNDPLCEWVSSDVACTRRGRFLNAVVSSAQCEPQCHEVNECSTCIGVKNCAWCAETQTCLHFPTYISAFIHGECSHWFDQEDGQCPSCSNHQNCADCMDTFQCGWCGNVDDPTIGVCQMGDFSGPFSDSNCTALVADAEETSLSDPSDWSYEKCPDVDECRLERHDCHDNATCVNTYEAYLCECNHGFEGDGKEFCNRTCYHTCEFGLCSGAPDYECICDLGWTAVSCNISCGCNNHSTCVNGVGLCDECQEWSTGTYCEMCLTGSYGNATTPAGCLECDCHGHGNASLGNCDGRTGVCYCTGNTLGNNCETCEQGFFGQPETGGKCYQRCEGRSIITDAFSSTLGSYEGIGVADPDHGYCLWILTTFGSLEEAAVASTSPGAIALTIDSLDVECGRDYIHVYDGIPEHLWEDFAVAGESQAIGVYCGHSAETAIKTTAYSGVMTIVFQANVSTMSPTKGFTAIYDVRTCQEDCDGNWHCANEDEDETEDDEVCECNVGFTGDDCEEEICPDNCGLLAGRGTCDDNLKVCMCNAGYRGSGCEHSTTQPEKQSKAIWSLVYDADRLSASDLDVRKVGPASRMGATLVSDQAGKFWLFGGYSHDNHRLNDVWSYDTSTSQWTSHAPQNALAPTARNYHAAAFVPPNKMIVSGGLSDTGVFSDWWIYDLTSHTWTDVDPPIADLEIAGHTMTMIDDSSLIVVGGYSPKDGLLSKIIMYDTATLTGDYKKSGGTPPTGLFGHSTVWHEPSSSLYVFGGYRFHLQSLAVSDKLYAFHFPSAGWSILPSEGYRPEARMLHSAVTFSDYMLVLGGFAEGEEISDNMLVYHYSCNTWQSLDAQGFSIGAQPDPLHSHAAVMKDDTVYLFGGYDGTTYGSLSTAVVPTDLCTLQSTVAGCLEMPGCSACVGDNSTLMACFSNQDLSSVSCPSPNTLENGTVCDNAYIEGRDCVSLFICSECVTVYPAHFNADQPCKWCYNCPDGACIPTAANCLEEHNCQVETQNEYHDRSACSEISCEASDCEKCTSDDSCIWTRQFKRSSETRRLLNYKPIYDWNCFSNRLLTVAPSEYVIETIPPLSCPSLCHRHTTCGDCLNSVGADGGWQECMWSTWLNQCVSPTYLHLRCSVGECGPVVQGASDNCPTPCFANTQCSHCLRQAWCGWCPVPQDTYNGTGICLSGGLHGPTDGECSSQEISWMYGPLPADVANATVNGIQGTPQWTYLTCPPENECLNGNHDCRDNEQCTDTYESFECNCKTGYARASETEACAPVCSQACGDHGRCVAPEECECFFGFVGHDCTVKCACNGHSNCRSETEIDVCLECRNNTTGDHCEHCLPFFVGNPADGVSCTPCLDHCYGNSHYCMTEEEYRVYSNADPATRGNLSDFVTYGPKDDVFCVGCKNFSEGDHCDSCIDGYFKLDTTCQACDCNGHGEKCNKESGECTVCLNNTMSPQCPSEEYQAPCWEHQCSQCINDLFKGTPTDSHQCYRQMHVDNDICFDPESQTDCPINPEPLPDGAASFFVIMPKYSDLDIRLTVDITYGALDVYITYDSDVFIVSYDEEMQQQVIAVDEDYVNASTERKRRSIREFHASNSPQLNKRKRRSGNESISTTQAPSESDLMDVDSHGLNTFINIEDEHFITVVRDLRNRLVITFPRRYHTLTSRRFYIALMGRGVVDLDSTQGIMYFRQDQPHIDLFIFFSVFLSCFFLFLAFLIGIWKVKVGVEARQHRRMHLLEMEHRASRPFGQVLLYYESPSIQTHAGPTPAKTHSMPKKPLRLSRIRGKTDATGAANREREAEEAALHSPEIVNERFPPGLIASEPTDDGMATVGTVVFALPGQLKAPVRACLGSALVTLKTTSKQTQEGNAALRQQRQAKNLKPNILCNTNNRR